MKIDGSSLERMISEVLAMSEPEMEKARDAHRRLDGLMRVVATIADDLEKLEDGLTAPSMEEFEEMRTGKRPYTYSAVVLGIGLINTHLDEVVIVFWKSFAKNLDPTCPVAPTWFFEQILGSIIKSR